VSAPVEFSGDGLVAALEHLVFIGDVQRRQNSDPQGVYGLCARGDRPHLGFDVFRDVGHERRPRVQPVSALDYITGYLAAFGVMVALARRVREGVLLADMPALAEALLHEHSHATERQPVSAGVGAAGDAGASAVSAQAPQSAVQAKEHAA